MEPGKKWELVNPVREQTWDMYGTWRVEIGWMGNWSVPGPLRRSLPGMSLTFKRVSKGPGG